MQDLLRVRSQLSPIVNKNKDRVRESESTFDEDSSSGYVIQTSNGRVYWPPRSETSVEKEDYASYIVDIREYDVIYYQRVSIDSGKLLNDSWSDVHVLNQF